MTKSWQKHRDAVAARAARLAPVTFIVPMQGTLAVAVEAEAMHQGITSATLIAEAMRAYLGDGV